MPRAASLAEHIKKNCGIEPVLVKGDGGVFDVRVDGRVLFSKKALGWFPSTEEVVEGIRKFTTP
ncbi:MAG: Rdx family protein [Pseudomonadota bacterium]